MRATPAQSGPAAAVIHGAMRLPEMKADAIGPYRIEGRIGAGGMGVVYQAWDERLHRRVAVKHIRHDKTRDRQFRRRFRREAKAAAQLNHPAVVQIFDVVEEADGDWIVMEYVNGRPLSELLRTGSLKPRRLLRLAIEIAQGLAEAHGKGLVHRDLKPQNVIVTPAFQAKILDFGLAKSIGAKAGDTLAGETLAGQTLVCETLTGDGALIGTFHAMSPEQIAGRDADPRSDLFSLGSLLYEAATGTAAFRCPSPLETLKRVVVHRPEPASQLNHQLPPGLSELIERLLEKEPNHRPQDANEVIDQLRSIHDSWQPTVRPAPPPEEDNSSEDVTLDPDTTGVPTPLVRTLLLAQLVDEAELGVKLGDAAATAVAVRHDRLARDLLQRFEGLEIHRSDRFLLIFERPIDAVRYALAYHQAMAGLAEELQVALRTRVGIHLGEITLRTNPSTDVARGAKPLEVDGLAKTMVARIMALAGDRQTLITRSAFDLARRASVDRASGDHDMCWLAHGNYTFHGAQEPVDIFEVGIRDVAPLAPPPSSPTARRAVPQGDEVTLGWRPAANQKIPTRPHWYLEQRLGAGGFGEVWTATHCATGERRVFKFCYEADRLRSLQREVTLFRLLKETLGQRDDIARILDWNLDEAPYFLEAEYTDDGDLVAWAQSQGGLETLPLETRLGLVIQVADALAAAHSVGILHKDVKPSNVLVTTDSRGEPRIRLSDFGIGLVTDRSLLEERDITIQGLTETMLESGSRLYLAPEIAEGKAATIQADIYALGVMLYQIVVGDFSRALAPGWRRHVEDELLAEDIACFADGSPGSQAGHRQGGRSPATQPRRTPQEATRRTAPPPGGDGREPRLGAISPAPPNPYDHRRYGGTGHADGGASRSPCRKGAAPRRAQKRTGRRADWIHADRLARKARTSRQIRRHERRQSTGPRILFFAVRARGRMLRRDGPARRDAGRGRQSLRRARQRRSNSRCLSPSRSDARALLSPGRSCREAARRAQLPQGVTALRRLMSAQGKSLG